MDTLANNQIEIAVSRHGAELTSIKKNGTEYLWQGDPEFWNRQSPVLFPIVGSVWDGRYRAEGREFTLGQHGFARDMEFELVEKTPVSLTYSLTSDENTLKLYPWKFRLTITYTIDGPKLKVAWKVTNLDGRTMWFQIGAHPAFYYPHFNPSEHRHGYFSFKAAEGCNPLEFKCSKLATKGCVEPGATYTLTIPENGLMELDADTFDEVDTFVMENSQLDEVTLHCPDGTAWLRVSFMAPSASARQAYRNGENGLGGTKVQLGAPVVGLWSPPHQNAPFVCIEPWCGRCDRAGYEGDFSGRDWVNSLEPDENFETEYSIEIL